MINIIEQTTCKVCNSKLSGQYIINDNTIYLFCELCKNNGNKNGFHYKMIDTIDKYKENLEYLQIIEV